MKVSEIMVTDVVTLTSEDTIAKALHLMADRSINQIPVVDESELVGIVSETDLVSTADFGHAIVDEVMSGAIVIEENTSLADAISKMRRYNISRLPVINTKGILRGTLNMLDIAKIIATPRERTSKSAAISGGTAGIKDVKVKDIARRAVSVERGTKLNVITDHFRRNEEAIVVGDGRPMGIVTPKDALELILPKR